MSSEPSRAAHFRHIHQRVIAFKEGSDVLRAAEREHIPALVRLVDAISNTREGRAANRRVDFDSP